MRSLIAPASCLLLVPIVPSLCDVRVIRAEEPVHALPVDPPKDIGDELAHARKAWEKGDALGAEALRTHDFGKLDLQDAAYKEAESFFRVGLKKDEQHPLCLAEYA